MSAKNCCEVDSTDSKRPILRCHHCGAITVLVLPMLSSDAGQVMRAFDKIHAKCKKAWKELHP
jgi:hypothetical protein